MRQPTKQPEPKRPQGIGDTMREVGYDAGGYVPVLGVLAILPSQLTVQRQTTPERRLLVAVLENALLALEHTAIARSEKAIKQRRETVAWFTSDDVSRLFAFRPLCEHLGLEPDAVLRSLEACRWVPRPPRRDYLGRDRAVSCD